MVAAAQGMAAVNAELDAQYDKEYALISLMEGGAEKQQELFPVSTTSTIRTGKPLPRNMQRRSKGWSCRSGTKRISNRQAQMSTR